MSREHYTRGPPPLVGNGTSMSMSMSASLSPNGMNRALSQQSIDQTSPPPRITPSSRMALSALVNSPTGPAQTSALPSPSPNKYPTTLPPIQSLPIARNGLSRSHSHHSQGHGQRYISPEATYPYRSSGYDEYHQSAPSSVYRRSPSPVYAYRNGNGNGSGSGSGSGSVIPRGQGRHSRSPVKRGLAMRMGDKLVGNEDVWEAGLQVYQRKREQEVDDLAALSLEDIARLRIQGQQLRTAAIAQPATEPDAKPFFKPKGSVGDRIAKEMKAGPSTESHLVKKPSKRAKPKDPRDRTATGATAMSVKSTLEDELLGLVEGEEDHPGGGGGSRPRASSPPPYSDDELDDDDHDTLDVERFDPDMIVQPSGLTRAEIIAKVQRGHMAGLTELDVKAVQDEMWLREKAAAPMNKDGTVRRKPGPAKGWKKLRGGIDWDERSEGTSIGEGTVGERERERGDADAEIAALLGEDDEEGDETFTPGGAKKAKAKSLLKKRKLDLGSEGGLAEGSGLGSEFDSEDDRSRTKSGPGVGTGGRKGKSKAITTATGPEHDLEAELEMAAIAMDPQQAKAEAQAQVEPVVHIPNTQDPRGVSEAEARHRLHMVEDLEKLVWASICRDIPRMYRVYQACDSAAKQNASRTAQACYRNAFAQRAMKPSFKSVARINKDAITKGKRVVKEMLVFWKKNEKEELAARKKAEKEALERAKAEEEAREAKRQSRKLNFLLTQTELYSHFIGKKIKTHEAEDSPDVAGPSGSSALEGHEDLGLDENGEPLPDIDYDDDDEENLRRHAARGAQAAVKAAKDRAQAFDDSRGGKAEETLDLDGDELNFQNPSLGQDSVTITQPKMLMAQLKEYQLKGLTWLGNLYEQGINGILADEMGLGKTIQSISLLAYLAEHHNLWGPFLVIAPASTLHNWQQELARFVPRLKALPYWGSPKDRETLRKIWSRKNMTFSESSPFHVLVTSYQLAVQDEKYFQGMKWQYMILDEAQAIKSSSSNRWKSLLSLHCRNRLLLTGTPIQNSMQELWALLHFIMPSLFDSHEEFSEWFSKDIENAAGSGGGTLKPEQLRRLHMILKPFMLRRVKKHVQKELGDKIEIDLLVDLSQRQRSIYKALRQRVSVSDLIAQANNLTDSGTKNLMNLVMQFRKVCNHPDLFERADVISPFLFGSFSHSGNLNRQGDLLYCPDSASNAITVELPRIVWEEGVARPREEGTAGSDTHVLRNLMSIWKEGWVNDQLKAGADVGGGGGYGFVKLMGSTPGEVVRKARNHPLVSLLEDAAGQQSLVEDGPYKSDPTFAAGSKRNFALAPRVPDIRPSTVCPLRDITLQSWNTSYLSRRSARFAIDQAVAPRISPFISNKSYNNAQSLNVADPLVHQALYGLTPSQLNDPLAVAQLQQRTPVPPRGLILESPIDQSPIPSLRVPASQRLVVDSAKLARLDDLLKELKPAGHRVLLYFQMTRMMDLAEEYLIYRQYKYLRLDGSSPIDQRRDMVTAWQTNPDIFVFCLSTRAGGLGINLTAADTVIFYDHDWNPSNDAQAMDRAHRVGQTKQVTVYRLIARGTIEERIVKLARAKKDVQDIVVGTKSLTDVAKPSEIVSLFMDDEELAESVAKRKQAESHGYIAPIINPVKTKGLGELPLGNGDEDEDDFFSLKKKVVNGEDEDEVVPASGAGSASGGGGGGEGGKKGKSKRKAEGDPVKRSHKKKSKAGLGADGLPL